MPSRQPRDVDEFRKAAVAAGLTRAERRSYSRDYHEGHRWVGDGLPAFRWLRDDMAEWKRETQPQHDRERQRDEH